MASPNSSQSEMMPPLKRKLQPLFVSESVYSKQRKLLECGTPTTKTGLSLPRKEVSFAKGLQLETVHFVETHYDFENEDKIQSKISEDRSTRLSGEISILSSLHGRARRQLRDIAKVDINVAVTHGVRSKGHRDPKTGLPRWKYKYGNFIVITDHTSAVEVTSYKEPITIHKARITTEMSDRNRQVRQILQNEPHLCTSHTFVVLDQSGSMRTADVNGFRNRSQAAYGCLALDFVAEQLYARDGENGVDSMTMVEMSDCGTVVMCREPLDWILFNKLVDRQSTARPKSHGNYMNSLQLADTLIRKEIANLADTAEDDFPEFFLVLLSDGKPSDKDPRSVFLRSHCVKSLAMRLNSKLTLYCMGLGASSSEFETLEHLSSLANQFGARGEFVHAGLAANNISEAFSSISSTMTSLRETLLNATESEDIKVSKAEIVALRKRNSMAKSSEDCLQYTQDVRRLRFDGCAWKRSDSPWREIGFYNNGAIGFSMDKIPFGEGAERLAFRCMEISGQGENLGKLLVAKETKRIRDDEQKKERFQIHMCRTQAKAYELANLFNKAVKKSPSLQAADQCCRVPVINFLKCDAYEFTNTSEGGILAGVLVERFLSGKWTKFTNNNGKVLWESDQSAELEIGDVRLTDFLDAFTHWTYYHSGNKLLVSDLQGVLNGEGRYPKFELTDPAICSRSKRKDRYGRTDIGVRGIRNFGRCHKCNLVCKGLGLPRFGE